MQTNCPRCSQKLVVEDEKVPAGPFMLRCPKCQNALRLSGKSGSPETPGGAHPGPASQPEAPSTGQPGSSERALIALADKGLQDALISVLRRSGYGVEIAAEPQQGVRLLERNRYALVVTTPNGGGAAGGISLYRRIVALAPEARRDLFLVLVGSDFSSGDGTQAFAAMADLVLNPKDAGASGELLRSTVTERTRLYQAFLEAHARLHDRRY